MKKRSRKTLNLSTNANEAAAIVSFGIALATRISLTVNSIPRGLRFEFVQCVEPRFTLPKSTTRTRSKYGIVLGSPAITMRKILPHRPAKLSEELAAIQSQSSGCVGLTNVDWAGPNGKRQSLRYRPQSSTSGIQQCVTVGSVILMREHGFAGCICRLRSHAKPRSLLVRIPVMIVSMLHVRRILLLSRVHESDIRSDELIFSVQVPGSGANADGRASCANGV